MKEGIQNLNEFQYMYTISVIR